MGEVREGSAGDSPDLHDAVGSALVLNGAAAKDTTGRKLFAMFGPANAPGEASLRYSRLNVHGVEAFPGWALAATGSVAANSYLFDRESVLALASPPQRLGFESKVATVDLAVWGYQVVEVVDPTGVRRVVYDPV